MILALVLVFAPYIDVYAELRLPVPECVPSLVGLDGEALHYPPTHPLVFHVGDQPVRLVIASTCQYPRWICLDWRVSCDSECVWAGGSGRTSAKDEVQDDDSILLTVPLRCWSMSQQVACRIEYWPSALGDLNGDCTSDLADVRILAGLNAPNRLGVFGSIQNEGSFDGPRRVHGE